MRLLILVTAIVALPMVSLAQSYQAVNRLAVVPLEGNGFEVIEDRGEGARGIWCAAADFAIEQRGAAGPARLYVKTALGPSVKVRGGRAVGFTLDEAELSDPPVTAYSVTVRQPGLNLPVGHAIQFCRDYLIELDDF